MNNNERVYNCLKDLTREILKGEDIEGVETIQIAEILSLRRNVVSHHLNQLVEAGKVIKTKTRPVYFLDKEVIEELSNKNKKQELDVDIFSNLVGNDGSLSGAVELCKSAVLYPNGIPILFTGASGVGKSYIASLVHKYAIEKKAVEENAPFIIFNCADYANNPELLSANLFGYKKGAFTGADKDYEGVIEVADGGYLFLDEVHRLPPEGQEKLFIFLDQGTYKRLGESKVERKAKVRMLFATTEDPRKSLLETFVRRIPLIVDIPSLTERTVEERVMLIYKFFFKEAKHINRNIKINKAVVNFMLSQKSGGNVGSLKNLVKSVCAYIYRKQMDEEIITISIKDIAYIVGKPTEIKEYYTKDVLYIDKENENISLTTEIDDVVYEYIGQLFEDIKKNINNHVNNKINKDELRKKINAVINKSLDLIIYNDSEGNRNELIESLYLDTINRTLKLMEDNYGFKYYGNTSKIITKIIIFFKRYPMIKRDYTKDVTIDIKKEMSKILNKENILIDTLFNNIKNNLDCEVDIRAEVIISMYVLGLSTNISTNTNAFIVAHGYSTASSIASVANMCYEEFVFEAFDMPVDMKSEEIVKKIKTRLKDMDKTKDTLILIDTGSLINLHKDLKEVLKGNLGIINNITTNIALEIAGKIINNESLKTMLENIQKSAKIQCDYYEAKVRKKAILTTCISGMGTSSKIKELMEKCLRNSEIEVIAYEYNKLISLGKDDSIFQEYNVELIISTAEINIEGIECILLENLMSDKGEAYLANVLNEMIGSKNVEAIRLDMAKMFSLENIINQLTILNPNKIINEVEAIVTKIHNSLGVTFKIDLKMVLYIHISIMIERLILKQGLVDEESEEEYIKCNSKFIDIINKAFSVIKKEYKLELTIKEIEIIQGIIESRMGELSCL